MKLSDVTGGGTKLSDLVKAPSETGMDRARRVVAGEAKSEGVLGRATDDLARGFTAGGTDLVSHEVGGLTTRAANLVDRVTGHPIPYTAEEFQAAQNEERGKEGLGGHALEMVGATVSPISKLVGAGEGLGGALLGGAKIGGLTGLAEGQGNPLDRAKSAAAGAVGGALTGGALHGAGQVGKEVWRGADALSGYKMGDVLSQVLTRAKQVLGRPAAPQPSGAERAAGERLREALHLDGVDEAKASQVVADWHRHGNEAPALLNIAGNNTRAVLRGAGTKLGESRNTLVAHREATRADQGAREGDLTRRLTGSPKSLSEHREDLERTRDDLASKHFREPYAQPIPLDEDAFKIVDSDAGRQAIAEAWTTAKERSLSHPESAQQVKELASMRAYEGARREYEGKLAEYHEAVAKAADHPGTFEHQPDEAANRILKDGSDAAKSAIRKALGWKPAEMPVRPEPPKPPTISAGTLDRVRIALRDKGRTLYKAGKLGRGGGVADREKALNAYLDQVPHLKNARATYHDLSNQIRASEWSDHILNMTDREFAHRLSTLTPSAKETLKKVAEEQFLGKAGGTSRQAMAIADHMATSKHAEANIKALFGDEKGSSYIQAMRNERDRLRHANYVAPDTGSQTHDRFSVGQMMHWLRASHSPLHALALVADGAGTMTREEADALARMGLGEPKSVLEQLRVKPANAAVQEAKRRALMAGASQGGGAASELVR